MRLLPPPRWALIPSLWLLAGCGGDDPGFTAQQFVDSVNRRGATLELGPELRSTRADAEVYAVELREERAGTGTGTPASAGEAHAGGSLVVMPSVDAGREEWERCERAASLLCYRADNIVLLLEGDISTEQEAALAGALGAIADEAADQR